MPRFDLTEVTNEDLYWAHFDQSVRDLVENQPKLRSLKDVMVILHRAGELKTGSIAEGAPQLSDYQSRVRKVLEALNDEADS